MKGFGVSPTSILQRKIGICIDECTACHNNASFQSVSEKKELPVYHVKRHKALTVRIAGLTEDLEELRSEKALLLQKFEYAARPAMCEHWPTA